MFHRMSWHNSEMPPLNSYHRFAFNSIRMHHSVQCLTLPPRAPSVPDDTIDNPCSLTSSHTFQTGRTPRAGLKTLALPCWPTSLYSGYAGTGRPRALRPTAAFWPAHRWSPTRSCAVSSRQWSRPRLSTRPPNPHRLGNPRIHPRRHRAPTHRMARASRQTIMIWDAALVRIGVRRTRAP